jgi:hypothetical protein
MKLNRSGIPLTTEDVSILRRFDWLKRRPETEEQPNATRYVERVET